jgi:DUF4097 and DUF4098 domain-containing protein YvlB
MKKFTLVSLTLALVCWVVSGILLVTFGEKGFEDMSQEIVGSKLIQFQTKTQDLTEDEVGKLEEIELSSANSSIELLTSEDSGLHVEYPSTDKASVQERIENKKIKYDFTRYMEGSENKLVVRLFKDHGLIHIGDVDSGKIIIKIPKNSTQVNVRTQGGDLRVTGVNGALVHFETASGDLRIKASNFSKVEAASASGDLRFQGYAQKADLKTDSGDIKVQSENKSPVFSIGTATGDVSLDFLDNPDVKVTFDTESGEIAVETASRTKGEKDKEEPLNQQIKIHNVLTLGKATGEIKVRTQTGD